MENRALWGVVGAGILLRLIPILLILLNSSHEALYDGDSGGYQIMGRALAQGDIFFLGEGARETSFMRTPGYPIFLGAFYFFGMPDAGTVVLQVLLDAASIVLVWRITEKMFGERAALAAAALYAFSPLFISFSFKILTETLFMFFFLLSNWLFLGFMEKGDAKKGFWGGLAMGVAVLVRPVAIPIPILYAAAALLLKKRKEAVLVFLVVSYLPAGAWVVRNYAVFGEPVFSGISDITYVCWHGPEVAKDPGLDRAKWGAFIEEYGLEDPNVCASQPHGKISAGKGNLTAMIMERPLNYARAVGMGAILLFSPMTPNYVVSTWGMEPPHFGDIILEKGFDIGAILGALAQDWAYLMLFLLFSAYQLVVYAGAAYGIWVGKGDKKVVGVALLGAAILAYLIFVGGPVNMYSGYRYRVPLEPFLLALAGYGVAAASAAKARPKRLK